jgi:hypothetical protein
MGVRFIFLFYTWIIFYLWPMIRVCCMRWNNLSKTFYIKDMGEASYVICIKIYKDRFKSVFGSQETFINKVFEKFWMNDCSSNVTLIVKGDRFNLNQCPKKWSWKERNEEHFICSCCKKQVCTRFDIAFVVGMLITNPLTTGMLPFKFNDHVMKMELGSIMLF